MGAKALFIEHPTDRSNAPGRPIEMPFTRLGPYLARCFTQTFVDGLHAPQRRADAAEWELALYRTLQLVYPMPSGQWSLIGPGLPMTSMRGDERVAGPVIVARNLRDTGAALVDEGDVLVLWHHLALHDWHLRVGVLPNERAVREARGYVAQHAGKWWLVNTSETAWHVIDGPTIGRNASLECTPGLTVRIGDERPARVLRFDLLH